MTGTMGTCPAKHGGPVETTNWISKPRVGWFVNGYLVLASIRSSIIGIGCFVAWMVVECVGSFCTVCASLAVCSSWFLGGNCLFC